MTALDDAIGPFIVGALLAVCSDERDERDERDEHSSPLTSSLSQCWLSGAIAQGQIVGAKLTYLLLQGSSGDRHQTTFDSGVRQAVIAPSFAMECGCCFSTASTLADPS
jgi:hypothetical protein